MMGGEWRSYIQPNWSSPAAYWSSVHQLPRIRGDLTPLGLLTAEKSSSNQLELVLRAIIDYPSYTPPIVNWLVNNNHIDGTNQLGFNTIEPYDLIRGETWGTRLVATPLVAPATYEVQLLIPQTGEVRYTAWIITEDMFSTPPNKTEAAS